MSTRYRTPPASSAPGRSQQALDGLFALGGLPCAVACVTRCKMNGLIDQLRVLRDRLAGPLARAP